MTKVTGEKQRTYLDGRLHVVDAKIQNHVTDCKEFVPYRITNGVVRSLYVMRWKGCSFSACCDGPRAKRTKSAGATTPTNRQYFVPERKNIRHGEYYDRSGGVAAGGESGHGASRRARENYGICGDRTGLE